MTLYHNNHTITTTTTTTATTTTTTTTTTTPPLLRKLHTEMVNCLQCAKTTHTGAYLDRRLFIPHGLYYITYLYINVYAVTDYIYHIVYDLFITMYTC